MTENVDQLAMWNIFDGPSDNPAKFVARKCLIGGGSGVPLITDSVVIGDTLEEVRGLLPQGLYCMPRYPEDPPDFVECWL